MGDGVRGGIRRQTWPFVCLKSFVGRWLSGAARYTRPLSVESRVFVRAEMWWFHVKTYYELVFVPFGYAVSTYMYEIVSDGHGNQRFASENSHCRASHCVYVCVCFFIFLFFLYLYQSRHFII